MRTPTPLTSMGGLLLLGLLAACVCGGGWAADGSRGRHIRRITAAELPPAPDNSSSPVGGGADVVLNKNEGTEVKGEDKPFESEKLPTDGSKDLDRAEDKTIVNSTETVKLNKVPNVNITNPTIVDSGKDSKAIIDIEVSRSLSDTKEVEPTLEATRGNATNVSIENETITTPKEPIDAKIPDTKGSETSAKETNSTEVLLASGSTYRGRRPTAANNVTTTTTTTAAPNATQEATEAPPKRPKEVNINEVVSTNRGSPRRLRKPVVVKKNGVVVTNLTRSAGDGKNCSDCDADVAPSTVTEASNSAEEALKKGDLVNATTTTRPKPVSPSVGAFNNLEFSSTARTVLEEKIHEDILHHLTTVSYAHYETDYVMDDDDAYDAEAQASRNVSSFSGGVYDGGAATSRSVLFDEAYARISEDIQHNVDEIEAKSAQFEAPSEHVAPVNDSHVSLEFTNHVDILANRNEKGNKKSGDFSVENGTHVDFERSFVETKIIPKSVSTVRYLIDDVHSTTRIIPTKDSKDRSNNIREDKDDDQSLEGAEEDAVTAVEKPVDTQGSASNAGGTTTTEPPSHANRTQIKLNASDSQTLNKLRSQGRGRMFPSERIHANNSNNVDERPTESAESKRLRTRTSQESSNSSTVTPRSRSFLLRSTSPFPASRRVSVDATEPTSPRNSILLSRSSLFRQGASQDNQTSTSPRNNLFRNRVSHRYSTPSNNTIRQSIPFTAEDAIIPTTTRSNQIRIRPPIKYYQQVNDTRPQPDNTHNDEGNDIPRNGTPAVTRHRGGTKFAGVSASSLSNEEFPIPPTAAAWSLVTLREPSLRVSVDTRTSPILQLVDENDSLPGSPNTLTTLYSRVTPTASDYNKVTSVTSSFSKVTPATSIYGKVPPTTSLDPIATTELLSTTPAEAALTPTEGTTELTTTPLADFTTIKPSSAREEEESATTPVEATSFKSVEEVRFDVETTVSPPKTTQLPVIPEDVSEAVMTTTLIAEVSTLTKDENADGVITTTESPGLLGFGSLDAVLPEDGIHDAADTKEGEEEKEGEEDKEEKQADEGKLSQQEEDAQLGQGEVDYGGPTGPDAGGEMEAEMATTTSSPPSSSLVAAVNTSKQAVEVTTTARADTQTVSINNVSATDPPDEAPETTTATDDDVTTQEEVTATSVPVRENENATTSSPPPDEPVQPARKVPAFLRVFVEATPSQFCETLGTFKQAVADLLTKGSGRIVSSDQVILRNFGREACFAPDNSTSPGTLVPVELHLVDEAVNFDRQLNEAFPLIWGQEDMDFPLRILKVDVVAVPDDMMTSGVENAGVIAAIAISCIGAVCLMLLAVLLVIMRKRQKKFNYGMRCTPVSLDAYSLDSVSIHDSVRRKAGLRASKRSYGNPAFDDPTTPSHSLNFAGLTAFSTERGAIEDEFARISHVTPKADELPPGSETKNRYANVLPLPETRVILSSKPHEQLGDYINANYVTGPKNAANFYIACQAPLPSTITDFWRMVWEQQSKVIMMLTELVENGVEKCADYLPPSEVLDCHRLFGDFQVTLKKREVREKYVISTLQLKNLESNSWREVTHLWYVSWPTTGVPEEPNSMIAFLIEARSYMKNRSGPSVVHCSPGTGRTGTVLACDLSIREFEHTRQVDIPRCVARLRRDRAGCVQTRDQYAFIYQVLTLYATKLTGGALDSI